MSYLAGLSTKRFEYVWNMVLDLKSTSSTIDKQNIIEDYCIVDDQSSVERKISAEFTKSILLYTYHPLWQYNVTSDNIKKKKSLCGERYDTIFELLNALKNRDITGHDAIGAVNTFIDSYPDYEELILCIIDKDLKTRAGDKIINKAIANHIPEFSVALADKYEPKLVDWKDEWYVSRKLDGVRCLCIVDNNGNPTFYSRTGKEFNTLGVVADGITSLGLSGVVFDGELCLLDEDGNEDFQGIMKQLKKKDHTIPNPSYKIFDVMSQDDFNNKKGKTPLSKRLSHLERYMQNNECPCLTILEQEHILDDDHFQEWVHKADINGWEGVMLRKNAPYKGKRSKDLLKVKTFHDAEYEVLDVEMGPFRYVKNGAECEEDMLSCVYISHKDHLVRVGSGFTIEERQDFYQDKNKILGKVIQVQYFEETKNQEGGISLRFPTFKYLYGDTRTV
jgi:DNA ligase-1